MNPLRFAIVGCGRVAGNHLNAINELPGATLAAVCDIAVERAQNYSRQFGVPWYEDYHEMLRKEAVDVVCVITPSGMHPTHALDLIQTHGKHLVVEKPAALKLSDLDAMKQAAHAAGVKLFPVYQNRYNKAVSAVKSALAQGALGKIALTSMRLYWCRPQRYYNLSPWRGTWAMDGGAYTNQGIHYLDLLLHLNGDIESVCSMTATQLVSIEVEDTGVAVLRFANGALGTVEATTTHRPDDKEASITILGEKGNCTLAGLAANKLVSWTPDPALCAVASEEIPNAYGFGHKPFLADVIADLQGLRPHPVSVEDGTRAIRLLNALYRSAEDGRPVGLAEGLSSQRLGRFDAKLHNMYLAPSRRPTAS
ncbi:MAG: Gfo/Idh/MocA family oxidoreductase [Verrucomicrobia bacterium]|nr:Gfo/Idh/MocA family oxidoreductase [Verrucomicrobiota bacterium]